MCLIMSTCRLRQAGQEQVAGLVRAGHRCIYATWHNNTAYAVWCLRRQGLAMMASASDDGELIARAIEALGNQPVRGSSSAHGERAARAMIKAIRAGHGAAMTPDGPRGPKHRLQHGVLWIAALSGCPLVPYHVEANRQWTVNSWDEHKLPKPFATVYECFGEPFEVSKEALRRDAAGVAAAFEGRMMDNLNECQALARGQ